MLDVLAAGTESDTTAEKIKAALGMEFTVGA
jgi:hypothetical protein